MFSKDESKNLPGESGQKQSAKNAQDGLVVIATERRRQVEVKGYTPEHDDEHDMGELALAAALYAIPYDAEVAGEKLIKQDDFIGLHIALETGCGFYVKPETDKLRRLAKAGALIVAEIERIQRTNTASGTAEPDTAAGTFPSPNASSSSVSEYVRGLEDAAKTADKFVNLFVCPDSPTKTAAKEIAANIRKLIPDSPEQGSR